MKKDIENIDELPYENDVEYLHDLYIDADNFNNLNFEENFTFIDDEIALEDFL